MPSLPMEHPGVRRTAFCRSPPHRFSTPTLAHRASAEPLPAALLRTVCPNLPACSPLKTSLQDYVVHDRKLYHAAHRRVDKNCWRRTLFHAYDPKRERKNNVNKMQALHACATHPHHLSLMRSKRIAKNAKISVIPVYTHTFNLQD